MALHVLGPVLMTELLLPVAVGRRRAGSLFVTSGGMYTQALPVLDPDFEHGEYTGAVAYARSKRGQVELLPVLAHRWARPPGVVGARDAPGLGEHPRPGCLASPVRRRPAPGAPLRRGRYRHDDLAGRDRAGTGLRSAVARPPGPPDERAQAHARDRDRASGTFWEWVAGSRRPACPTARRMKRGRQLRRALQAGRRSGVRRAVSPHRRRRTWPRSWTGPFAGAHDVVVPHRRRARHHRRTRRRGRPVTRAG